MKALFCQDYLNVTNSYNDIEIKINSSEPGKLYYVLYTVDKSTAPTSAEIKTAATGATNTNIQKKGVINISIPLLEDTLTRRLISIPVNTSDSPKSYFMYMVFESSTSGLGKVVKEALPFYRKQRSFVTTSATHDSGKLVNVRHLVYLPKAYYHDKKRAKFPLIIFFHGDGQKGEDINMVRGDALPKYIDGNLELEAIVASPQNNGYSPSWDKTQFIKEFIDTIASKYNIDTTKIYGIGCSGGGGGMFRFVLDFPNIFAGMSSVSAPNIFYQNICTIKNIPFWIFHAINDGTVVYNNFKVITSDLTDCGPIVPLKKTSYTSGGHDCWKYALQQDSVYRFLLARSTDFKTNSVERIKIDTNFYAEINLQNIWPISIPKIENKKEFKYYWYQVSGADVSIKNNDSLYFSLIEPANGNYKFRLVITKDNKNLTYQDVVIAVGARTVTSTQDTFYDEVHSRWKVVSTNGDILREGTNSKPDTSGITPGIYFLSTDGKTHKILVK